jgi:type II secretory pathway component PulC
MVQQKNCALKPWSVTTIQKLAKIWEGFPILQLPQSGQMFAEVGMRYGDIITHINGIRVKSDIEAVRALTELPDETTMLTFIYLRDGVERTASIEMPYLKKTVDEHDD